jgi:hypothetical protein
VYLPDAARRATQGVFDFRGKRGQIAIFVIKGHLLEPSQRRFICVLTLPL